MTDKATSQTLSAQLILALAAMLLAVYAEYSGLDLWLAHQFYDPVHQQWPLRSLFITKTLLHDDAQSVVKVLSLLMAVLMAGSFIIGRLRPYRKPLSYLFVASVTGPLIVSLLKNVTHIQIPWQLAEFGGNMPYIRLFDPVQNGLPIGHAFPGGHSSGGFAFFSLYFLCYHYAPRYRLYGFMLPLITGLVFAMDQEVRGAHFISHDLMSLAICWSSAWFWSRVYLRQQPERDQQPGIESLPVRWNNDR